MMYRKMAEGFEKKVKEGQPFGLAVSAQYPESGGFGKLLPDPLNSSRHSARRAPVYGTDFLT